MTDRPAPHLGLHHLALFVADLAAARNFYVDLLGYRVEWEPDADNLYLTSGSDNLALHRSTDQFGEQRLDHIGIVLAKPEDVRRWHDHLLANGIQITAAPRKHRDGAESFYCMDPNGVRVQFIHHPPISPILARART
jgi:catechol 2,3-dioxygenase-like lactoylglutathione lyase family enzyme